MKMVRTRRLRGEFLVKLILSFDSKFSYRFDENFTQYLYWGGWIVSNLNQEASFRYSEYPCDLESDYRNKFQLL